MKHRRAVGLLNPNRGIQAKTGGDQAISCAVGFRHTKTALCDWTFFDWIILVLFLIVSRVDLVFYSFCALSRGGWCEEVLLYSR